MDSIGYGRFTASVADRYTLPRLFTSGPPVVFMLAGASTAVSTWGAAEDLATALNGIGLHIVRPSVPNLAGNATAQTRITNAVTYARNNLGATVAPPVMVGISNGAACAALYAADNPVTALVMILPPIDTDYIYENDVEGTQALLATAWGVTPPAPLPAEASVLDNAGDIDAPVQVFYATDDPLSTSGGGAAALAAATGAELNTVGALGHTDAAVDAVDPARVVAFLGNLA